MVSVVHYMEMGSIFMDLNLTLVIVIYVLNSPKSHSFCQARTVIVVVTSVRFVIHCTVFHGGCQAIVRQLSGSCQAAVRQLSGSCQAAVRQLSASYQEIFSHSSKVSKMCPSLCMLPFKLKAFFSLAKVNS